MDVNNPGNNPMGYGNGMNGENSPLIQPGGIPSQMIPPPQQDIQPVYYDPSSAPGMPQISPEISTEYNYTISSQPVSQVYSQQPVQYQNPVPPVRTYDPSNPSGYDGEKGNYVHPQQTVVVTQPGVPVQPRMPIQADATSYEYQQMENEEKSQMLYTAGCVLLFFFPLLGILFLVVNYAMYPNTRNGKSGCCGAAVCCSCWVVAVIVLGISGYFAGSYNYY